MLGAKLVKIVFVRRETVIGRVPYPDLDNETIESGVSVTDETMQHILGEDYNLWELETVKVIRLCEADKMKVEVIDVEMDDVD